MPTRPITPCRAPGCAALVPTPGYCDAHRSLNCRTTYDRTKRRDDPSLALAAKLRNSAQWQKVRAIHRQTHPLCCDPFGDHRGFPVPAEQSHHIQPLSTHPELAFAPENLAPLCAACHGKVERMERSGTRTQHLFEGVRQDGGTIQ